MSKAIPHKDRASDAKSDFSSECIKPRQAYWCTPRAFVFLSKYLNVLVFQVKSKIWWKTVVKDLVKHWHMSKRFDEMLAPSVENNPLDYFQHSPLAERPTEKSELPTKLAIRFMVWQLCCLHRGFRSLRWATEALPLDTASLWKGLT